MTTAPVALQPGAEERQIETDLIEWAERTIFIGETVPDFWDETNMPSRLAEWLTYQGYRKVALTLADHVAAVMAAGYIVPPITPAAKIFHGSPAYYRGDRPMTTPTETVYPTKEALDIAETLVNPQSLALALDAFAQAERQKIASWLDCSEDCWHRDANGVCQRMGRCSRYLAERISAGERP